MRFPILVCFLFLVPALGCSSTRDLDVRIGNALGPAADIILLADVIEPEAEAVEVAPAESPGSEEAGVEARYSWFGGDFWPFLGGVTVGFLSHEGGHVLTNYALGTDPTLKGVEFNVIPFFTIEPGRDLSDREHYITASAGFNMQNLLNELILATHPLLKQEDEPFLKGIVAFNLALSIGYAATGYASYGPHERDTNGMADSLGISKAFVATLILVPALLDAYRFEHPDADWAKYLSWAFKIATIGLTFTTDTRRD